MTTYLMTWNPRQWPWTELAEAAASTAQGDPVEEPWSCGNTKRIRPGDRLFLLKQGAEPRGIVASGQATSPTYTAPHWDPERARQGDETIYVNAVWDTILDPDADPLLETARLREGRLAAVNWATPASGIHIPDDLALELERLWDRHLADLGRPPTAPYLHPDEAEGTGDIGGYRPTDEDSRRRVMRQIKERRGQQAFRDALRRRYGDQCMLSGCRLIDVVEAAHIKPYRGVPDNHPENGLLLRADLHTLFDLDLLGIEPSTLRIHLHPDARAAGYNDFENERLRCPDLEPSQDALQVRWSDFQRRLQSAVSPRKMGSAEGEGVRRAGSRPRRSAKTRSK
jgi:hypothetical protein